MTHTANSPAGTTSAGTSPEYNPEDVDELSGAQIGEQIGAGAAGGEVDDWAEMVGYLDEVGDRIRLQRAGRGWRKTQLAAAMGLSRNKIDYIEGGDPNLTVLQLHDLADAFGCSTADLLPDCGPPQDVDTGGPLPTLPDANDPAADDPAADDPAGDDLAGDDPAGEGRLREEVARRARSQRSYLRLNQDDVAADAGLTRTYVSGIERGARSLDAYRLLRLARALDTTLGWLLNDTHYQRPAPAQHPATPREAATPSPNPPRERR